MDPKRKQEIYAFFKSAFLKLSEQTVDYVKAKTQLSQEEIDQFLQDNLLYSYSENKEKIIKKEILEFTIYKLSSEEEIDIKILELKDKVQKLLGEVPYIRFNVKEGHLSLPLQNEDMTGKEIKVDDKHVIKVSKMSLNEKKQFSTQHGPHIEGIMRQKYGRSCKIKIHGLLSHKKGIYLGFTKFKSLQEVRNVFNKTLKNQKIGEKIGDPVGSYLKELVNYHPKCEKKMENFDHFEVGIHPEHQDTRCFFIIKKDETKEDFSYVKCIKEISRLIKQQIKWIKVQVKFKIQNILLLKYFHNINFQ